MRTLRRVGYGEREHTAQQLYFELVRATSRPTLSSSRSIWLSVAMVICIKALAELLERLDT